MRHLATIGLAAVGDSRDQDEELLVVDGVHDPVLAHSDAVVVAPCQFRCTAWSRLGRQGVDRVGDAAAERVVQAAIGPCGRGVEANLVLRFSRTRYARTSAQGSD